MPVSRLTREERRVASRLRLTDRQYQVLALWRDEHLAKPTIAQRLGLAEMTVTNHYNAILNRTHTYTMHQAALQLDRVRQLVAQETT